MQCNSALAARLESQSHGLCRRAYTLLIVFLIMQQIRCYACNQKGHLCCSDFFDNSLEQVSCYNCAQSGHSGLVSFNVYRPSNLYCCHMLLFTAGDLHWNFCYRDVLSNAGKLVLSQPQPYASNVTRKVTSHVAARRMPRLLL